MKLFSALALLLSALPAHAASFQDVWSATQNGPYEAAPSYQTSLSSFWQNGVNVLSQRANATIADDSDVLPPFQKLVHPIGICFAGKWTITEDSPYTGYFAKGSQGLIIVRASEALGNANAGDYRAFGLAGKLFPTLDKTAAVAKTANFFTVDDLGGTLSNSFLDLAKTNEPKTSFHLSQLLIFPMITEIATTLAGADSHVGIRQVYEISELGLADAGAARTPHWFALQPETTERSGASDFRDELRLANFAGGLAFGIYVAEDDGRGYTRLGEVKLDDEALADGCDHQLHFHHPAWKD